MGSRDEGGVCTPPLFVICHGGTGWVVASGWDAAPAAGWAGWRPVPTEPPARHGNPPPASRVLWERAQLGKRRRGTPRQIPGHFAFVRGYTGFLEAWKARNYGALGSYFPNFTNRTPSALACEARELCFSPSDRGIRDGGDCQACCRSSQPKIRFRTAGRS